MEAAGLLSIVNSHSASSCIRSTANSNLKSNSSYDPSILKCNSHQKFDDSCINEIITKQNHKTNSNENKIKNRVPFSKEEDEKIKKMVKIYGSKKWSLIASFVEGRTSKQCRDRYKNYLEPGFFNGEWSKEEDELILSLYAKYGPKWSKMAKALNDRSSSSIKNRWKYFLSRQLNDVTKKSDNLKKSEQENQDEIDNLTSTEYKLPKSDNFQIEQPNGATIIEDNAKNGSEISVFSEIVEYDFANDSDFWSIFYENNYF